MNAALETRRCENCGQPVLQSDSVCWHCGTRLSPPEAVPVEREEDPLESETLAPIQQILFYAILTALVALALLLVTRTLGRQPQYIDPFSAGGAPLAAIGAPDGSFGLELPANSAWYFPQAAEGHGQGAAQLEDDTRFAVALSPLVDLVPDAQVLLLAESEAGIFSLARSERLGRLTVDNVVASLRSEAFPGSTVTGVTKSENRVGAEVAAISVTQSEPALLCRQYFVPDDRSAYVAAACTTAAQFEERAPLLNDMLNSLVTR